MASSRALPFLVAGLLAAAVGPLRAAGPPVPGPGRRPPLPRIERVPLAPGGPASCLEVSFLRNPDRVHPVIVVVEEVQNLFSGPFVERRALLVEPGGRVSLGCSRWPGALAPARLRVVARTLLAPRPVRTPPCPPGAQGK